ncbi:MAG: cystathionine beta-synthase [Candidatus Sericytochromatia bacterium]|nr:MAG: cystathionine beta-synthase [Candidatus Sericytochromatia bacterium]
MYFKLKCILVNLLSLDIYKDIIMKYANNILELIGNTPLVKLNSVTKELKPLILAKLEYLNPGGSVKDRIGIKMIEKAEKEGLLKQGGNIVEPTSGNTGVGLAMVAAIKGYKCTFVMPDKMSDEKRSLLRAYGADVIITPTNVEPDSPHSYYSVSDRLAKELPNGYKPNQYANMANPQAHYETTGPEIWEQTDGKIDYFFAGMGTGGTISGVAKYLKEKNPNVKIIGVDPEGSLYSGNIVKPYKIEGIGEDFIPETIDLKIIDDIVTVNDKESFIMTRRLAREEGILVGGSCGAAVAGVVKYVKKHNIPENKIIVVLLPDSGRSYLSKIFNDDWMKENGFIDKESNYKVIDIINKKSKLNQLILINKNEKISKALELMKKYDISQLPVIEENKSIGTIKENETLNKILEDLNLINEDVSKLMSETLPEVESLDEVSNLINKFNKNNPAILVKENDKYIGIITKMDLISFLGG